MSEQDWSTEGAAWDMVMAVAGGPVFPRRKDRPDAIRGTTPTDEMREMELGMTNCPGEVPIEDGFEAALRAEPNKVFGRHSAWDFNGRVWFDGELFHDEIWVYHNIADELTAPTLDELRELANAKYGAN